MCIECRLGSGRGVCGHTGGVCALVGAGSHALSLLVCHYFRDIGVR